MLRTSFLISLVYLICHFCYNFIIALQVLAIVKASADTIEYEVDLEQMGDLIDSLCDMSRAINAVPSNT